MANNVESQPSEEGATNEMVLLVPDETVNERQECGVGRCKLPWLNRLGTIWWFLIFFYMFMFVQGIHGLYSIGILATLEKLYGLPSSKSAFIVSAPALGYVLSIGVVSYLCRKISAPKMFSTAALLNCVAGFVTVLPHFLYGTTLNLYLLDLKTHSVGFQLGGTIPPRFQPQFCNQHNGVISNRNVSDNACAISSGRDINLPAYYMLIFGGALQGISSSSVVPFGIPFFDNAFGPTKAPIFIGLLFAVRLLAPAFANLLSAFLLTFNVNFSGTILTPQHPQWIGAWWVWYLVSAVASLILAVLMIGFPGNLRDKNLVRPTQAEDVSKPRSREAKGELLPFLKSLLVNTMFLLLAAGFCCSLLATASIAFLPKYVEVHFRQPVSLANIITGAGPLLAIAVSIISSWLLESSSRIVF